MVFKVIHSQYVTLVIEPEGNISLTCKAMYSMVQHSVVQCSAV